MLSFINYSQLTELKTTNVYTYSFINVLSECYSGWFCMRDNDILISGLMESKMRQISVK